MKRVRVSSSWQPNTRVNLTPACGGYRLRARRYADRKEELIMDFIEKLKDVIHEELQDVAVAMRPRSSTPSTRHLPTGGLLEIVITSLIIPIFTSVVSGLLIHFLTKRKTDEAAEQTSFQLQKLEKELTRLTYKLEQGEEVDDTLKIVAAEFHQLQVQPSVLQKLFPDEELEIKITNVLREYHIGAKISRDKAKDILNKFIDLFTKDAGRKS